MTWPHRIFFLRCVVQKSFYFLLGRLWRHSCRWTRSVFVILFTLGHFVCWIKFKTAEFGVLKTLFWLVRLLVTLNIQDPAPPCDPGMTPLGGKASGPTYRIERDTKTKTKKTIGVFPPSWRMPSFSKNARAWMWLVMRAVWRRAVRGLAGCRFKDKQLWCARLSGVFLVHSSNTHMCTRCGFESGYI